MALFLPPGAAPTCDALPDLRGQTVLVLHAHPDDEAIFTAITTRRLADAGARVVLVTATGGELGETMIALQPDETLVQRRVAELERAADILGVARLVLLGYRDSGLPGWPAGTHPGALGRAAVDAVARRVAELALAEGAATLVHYDPQGIYGHPDHVSVHLIGTAAARLSTATAYQATVDREHLHFAGPGAHLVHGAVDALAGARSERPGAPDRRYGRVTAEIGLALAATPGELAANQAAIAAHASQIPAGLLDPAEFATAYQLEWYLRDGPPGALDLLGNVHVLAGAPERRARPRAVR